MGRVGDGKGVVRAGEGLEVRLKLLLHRALRLTRHIPHHADDFGNLLLGVGALTCGNGNAIARDRAAAGSVTRNSFVGHGCIPPNF